MWCSYRKYRCGASHAIASIQSLAASRKDMKLINLLIFILALSSCSANYELGNKDLLIDLHATQWTDLKENPNKYLNDTILISGKYHSGFEDSSIKRGSDRIWLSSFNPLKIDQKLEEKIIDRNIIIVGLFNPNNKGHLSQYLGSIEEIYYLKTK